MRRGRKFVPEIGETSSICTSSNTKVNTQSMAHDKMHSVTYSYPEYNRENTPFGALYGIEYYSGG